MLASDKRKKMNLTVVPTKVSQSTPTSHTHDGQPTSPAESTASFISSISDIAEKSASELGLLLKSAYKSLREKEKNLLLAAEVGKSLLEHNKNLKSDYDVLIQKIKSCEEEARRFSINSASLSDDEDKTMQLLCSKNTHEMMIDSLEKLNTEMQQALEQTQQEAAMTNQTNLQKQRKLEQEIEILKGNLDIAAQKVQELEEQNQIQQDRARQLDDKKYYEQRQHRDLELLEELTVQMETLFSENKQLHSSKKSVEDKLLRSLHDLDTLRQDFENFELTQQSYEALQDAFERQKTHIQELSDSLEEHRLILSQLRDKGVWSPRSSATPSLSGHQSLYSTTLSKQSLMGELENAWCKTHLPKSQSSSISSKIQEFANKTERNIVSFCNAPADYTIETLLSTVGIESNLLEETTQFLKSSNCSTYDLFEPDVSESNFEACNIYPTMIHEQKMIAMGKPKKGLLYLLQLQIRHLFSSLFQWCRFAIILTAAVMINLWKGPRLLLRK